MAAPPPLVLAPSRPSVITEPQWLRRPSAEDLDAFVPDEARAQLVSGVASMQCDVAANGRLENCFVHSEAPEGWGYGRAVLHAAKLFRMRPRTVDGQPVAGAKVRIPIRFLVTAEVPLICDDAPLARRVCVHDPDDEDPWNARRGAVAVALRQIEGHEPSATDRQPLDGGGFRWLVGAPVPVEDCPRFDGQPVCGGPSPVVFTPTRRIGDRS